MFNNIYSILGVKLFDLLLYLKHQIC